MLMEAVHHRAGQYRLDHSVFEASSHYRADSPLVGLRLDGRNFHSLTSSFEHPFDSKFEAAMDSAGTALLEAGLGVELAYLQSDEITLLIPEGRVPFDGRVEKLCSTFSALAAVDFSRHLDLNASFDCRVLHLNSEEDALACLLERQWDARKNALSMLVHWTLIQKRGMTAKQAHKFLKSLKHPQRVELSIELGVPFQELEDGRRMGRTIVYVPHLHQGYNPITKETVQVYRRGVQKLGSCPDFALCNSLPWHVKGPDSK